MTTADPQALPAFGRRQVDVFAPIEIPLGGRMKFSAYRLAGGRVEIGALLDPSIGRLNCVGNFVDWPVEPPTGIALLILVISAAVAWNHVFEAAMILPTMWTGLISGLVLSLVTVFKTQWAPVTTPLYAVFEGLFVGTISLLFNVRYPGIAFNAAALTLAILAALLLAYRSGWIHPSENIKLGIAAAVGSRWSIWSG